MRHPAYFLLPPRSWVPGPGYPLERSVFLNALRARAAGPRRMDRAFQDVLAGRRFRSGPARYPPRAPAMGAGPSWSPYARDPGPWSTEAPGPADSRPAGPCGLPVGGPLTSRPHRRARAPQAINLPAWLRPLPRAWKTFDRAGHQGPRDVRASRNSAWWCSGNDGDGPCTPSPVAPLIPTRGSPSPLRAHRAGAAALESSASAPRTTELTQHCRGRWAPPPAWAPDSPDCCSAAPPAAGPIAGRLRQRDLSHGTGRP